MKKYRYFDPSLRTPFERARPYIFMFVGWNLIGILTWKFINRRAKENDPEWEMRSQAEKVAALTGSGSQTATRKISLFGGSNKEKNEQDKS